MAIVFQILGIGCLIVAGAALLLTPAIFIEPRSVAESWTTGALLVALGSALTGLLLLGFASTLNILHDMRREVGRAAATVGSPAPTVERTQPAIRRPTESTRSAAAPRDATPTPTTVDAAPDVALEPLPPGVIRFPIRPEPRP